MNEANKTEAVFDRMTLWKEYENVAMHFNDLIIRLRSQSLGAVAAFATLAGVITKNDTGPQLRWGLLTGAFGLLAVFWSRLLPPSRLETWEAKFPFTCQGKVRSSSS